MRMRTGRKAAAFVAVLALTVAACGNGADDAPDDTAAPDEAPDDGADDDPADAPEDTDDAPEVGEGDPDVLNLGYILPETGDLAFLGPPMISGTQMAVQEINEAGGVLGNDVELLSGDEANDTGMAAEEASRLMAAGVDAIIGAAATGMTMAIIDMVTGAGIVQCSPSNTGPGLTTYDDGGFYFRTAPTDALQGPVIAERVIGDGHTTLAVAGRGDDYGQGLLDATVETFEAQGGEVVYADTYDPNAATFDSVVEDLVNSGADAYVLVSFAEGGAIVQGLLAAGTETSQLYGADGIAGHDFIDEVDPNNPNALDGMTLTSPSTQSTSDFDQKLTEFAPDISDRLFAPQSYDCVNLIALAAEAAGSTDSADIQANMIEVTVGDNPCATFAECKEILDAGDSIAYQSAAGDALEFTEAGEPSRGAYDVSQWIDGEFTVLETVVGTTVE